MKTPPTLLDLLLRYKQVIYIFVVSAALLGIAGLVLMPRDEWPQFNVPVGLIVGVFPGASSHQVEEQLTAPVEKYLFQYKSVNRARTHSISKENVMVIYVEIAENERDPEAFWAKLRHGLNELKGELPAGVLSLTADNDYGNTSALLFAVQSEGKTYKQLEQYIRTLEDDVRKVPSVSRVKRYGMQREQIGVYIDDAKLAQYGIKPIQVMAALKPQTVVDYAGDIDNGILERPIHIPVRFQTEQDIANQIIYADPRGIVLRVKDVARIVREYAEPDSHIRVNGQKCLIIALEMVPGNNVVQFGTDVGEAIQRFKETLPPDVSVVTISDIPGAVSRAIANFLKEFLIAICAVILVTIILLPGRIARIAAVSIPASILTAIGLMWVSGMDLQTVSLAGLIIVLGITVDDAIVIIDNYVEKVDHGMSPHDAGSHSVTELFSSVLSATLIIIACFLPMPYFLKGAGGDFVRSLPLAISYALLVSLVLSVTLIPLLNYAHIKTGIRDDEAARGKAGRLESIQRLYDRLLDAAFKRKRLVVVIGICSFLVGLIILALTPQQSFPKIERNQFAVEIYLPQGSSLEQTDAVMSDLEMVLRSDPQVDIVASFVGTSSPRFHTLYGPSFPSKNYGQMIVVTESNDATPEVLGRYSREMKNRYPNADLKWRQLFMAVAPSPIEIRVAGDSIHTIKHVASQVADILRNVEGTDFIRTDYAQPLQSADLVVRHDEASRLGLSNTYLAYSLMVGTKGFPVARIWEGDYPVDVRLMVNSKEKTKAQDILDQHVTTPLGVSSVPVRQVATLQPGWTEGEIARRNGVRTVTVRAEVDRGLYSSTVFNTVRPMIEALKVPEGVTVSYGGDYEDSRDYLTPFYFSLAASISVIFLILMFQFKKVGTSLLIMVTLPLTVFGAAFGVFVTGYPFGVTSFIGLIGLFGIVVRNGIIFVSYAEQLRRGQGYTAEQAAIAAGKRRMRPIFLTSAAAAVGVVPMIASGSSLWGPLGAVVCFGLLFALILSLVELPVFYYLFHRNETVHVASSEEA
ncbi:MAG: efflux RND transporter permease subunit [Bacteroidetes bacterium]|nr:efflux RND transporter permease subunit [Bacteroidota bacterium]